METAIVPRQKHIPSHKPLHTFSTNIFLIENPPSISAQGISSVSKNYLRFLAADFLLAGRFAALRTTFFATFFAGLRAGRFAADFFLAGIG